MTRTPSHGLLAGSAGPARHPTSGRRTSALRGVDAKPILVALLAWVGLLVASGALGQSPPQGADVETPFVCPGPDEPPPPPANEEEARERERRRAYYDLFPLYVAAAGPEVDTELLVPVDGVRVSEIADTWGGPRSGGRSHEGQDLFAPTGTPIRSATDGYVWRIAQRNLGGLTVTIVGGGGRRYYYAHLSSYADIEEGQRVTPETVIGYVGNTGNARTTPPHLHLGVYESQLDPEDPCGWDAIDPLPYLVDRN